LSESASRPTGARPTIVEKVRWSLIWPVFAVGTALTVASVVVSAAYNWQGIWPQVLLAWGTTIALTAALFGVQRQFVHSVRKEVIAVGEQVQANVEEVASNLEARLSGQVDRLEEVAHEARHLRDEGYAEADQLIDAVESDPSYGNVEAALDEAFNSGAISKGSREQSNGFRVRVGHPLDGLRLTFKFTPSMVVGFRILQIVAWPPPNASTRFSVNWDSRERAAAVFERLRATLAEARIAVSEEEFDILFALRNLVQSLRISIQAHRGQRARPIGRVVEIVDDRWAFTETGLESMTDNFSVSDLQFPKLRPASNYGVDPKEYKRPQAPPNVNPRDWEELMLVAEKTYPWPRPSDHALNV
jgi:hypothetical protein